MPIDDARAGRILARIRAIPEGFVSTYGDIDSGAPRLVGRVLSNHPDAAAADLPWHRVVRADGSAAKGARQLALLRSEDVPIHHGRVDMRRARVPVEHLWTGEQADAVPGFSSGRKGRVL